MPETFDPYYKWLGIPPAQQPPHHYRLLGIELFESDVEVIDMAANQRMSYLQEMAGGPHGKDSQRLLNEISAARRALLDKTAKAAYDEQLRAKLPKPTVVVESQPAAGSLDDTIHIAKTVNLAPGKTSAKAAAARTSAAPATKSAAPVIAPPTNIGPPAGTVAAAGAPAEINPSFNFKVDDTKTGKSANVKTTASKPKPAAKPAPAKSENESSDPPDSKRDSSLKKKSRTPIYALAGVLAAAAAAGGYGLYRRGQASAEQPVAAAPSATGSTSTADGSTAASSAAVPSASSASTPEAPYAHFLNATNSPSPEKTDTASGGAPPAASGGGKGGGKGKRTARTTAAAPKSPIVASAESSTDTVQFFTADAAAVAAAPILHLHFQPQQSIRLIGFFKSGAEYHLFHESNAPAGKLGQHVCGHFVSSNLLEWRTVTLAPPYDPNRAAQIGSIFVDADNASGLGETGKPVWLAVSTVSDAKAKTAELIFAASVDQGATWTVAKEALRLEGGFPADIRFPRIVRDAERKQWCLVAQTRETAKPASTIYTLYTSPDLKTWTKKQDIPLGEDAGAPEFFQIAEAAPGKARRWIFAGGNGSYKLGQFDGERFTTDNLGGQFFAAGYDSFRMLDDSPGESRRPAMCLIIGPAEGKQPALGIALALPRVVSLTGGEAKPAVSQADCDEVTALSGKSIRQPARDLAVDAPITITDCGPIFRFTVQIEAGSAEGVEVALFGEKVRVDFKAKTLTIAGVSRPYEASSIRLQGLVDRDIAELLMPSRVAFSTRSGPGVTQLRVEAFGGTAKLQGVEVVPLVRPAGKP